MLCTPIIRWFSKESVRCFGIAVVVALVPGLIIGQESPTARSANDSGESLSDKASQGEGQSDPDDSHASDIPAPTPDDSVPSPKRPLEEELHRTAEGKIRFSFQGQPWLEVLQWLAKGSGLTLDWQVLPEDKLNLTTQGSYTLDEARDLFNMHLAARGFTLLRRGEVLTLVKLDNLNPALVPRVEPHELPDRDRHEIVRVSFPLDWLVAEEAVKEFRPMLSPFGKLTPMSATNRLEAMDTVANLREVSSVLSREQSAHGESRLVVEFKLKHVQAEVIIDKLRQLVGGDASSRNIASSGGRNSDRARMMAQMARMREEAQRNQGQNQPRTPVRSEPEVHLVVNEHENSILANAPPDKLAVIRQAVQALDVPSAGGGRSSDVVTRMKIYRTKSVDPDSLAEMIGNLINMAKLDKNTQVQADDDSNTLIVYATPADHLAIANLVSQIDDGDRDVRIVTLRELDPHYALQAIKLLLQGEQAGRRRRGGSDDQFRIEIDAERSRLLMWANDAEFGQVQALLAKLGEGADATAARGNLRVLSLPSRGSQKTLENLQQIWPHVRTNPLRIQSLGESHTPTQKRATESSSHVRPEHRNLDDRTADSKPSTAAEPIAALRTRRSVLPAAVALAAAASGGPADDLANDADDEDDELLDEDDTADEDSIDGRSADEDQSSDAALRVARSNSNARIAANVPAAITLTESPSGQLIITSTDVEALDAAEKLIQQMMPPQPDYEVFRLKHASPFAVELTLRQIFALDAQTTRRSSASGLPSSTKPQLQFVSDVETGTLLVQGATAEELQKIDELIELYDRPESLDDDLERKTEIYEVQYSRADAVADVVKDVYRDLLSSNDRTFSRERRDGDGRGSSLGYGMNYATRIPQFKGLLSIGVEENSNTLVISAPAYLVGNIMKLVREVDERAAGHKVHVVQLNVGAESLKSVLSQIPGVTTNSASTSVSTASTGVGTPANSGASTRPSTASRGQPTSSTLSRGAQGGWNRPTGSSTRPGDTGRTQTTVIRRGNRP